MFLIPGLRLGERKAPDKAKKAAIIKPKAFEFGREDRKAFLTGMLARSRKPPTLDEANKGLLKYHGYAALSDLVYKFTKIGAFAGFEEGFPSYYCQMDHIPGNIAKSGSQKTTLSARLAMTTSWSSWAAGSATPGSACEYGVSLNFPV